MCAEVAIVGGGIAGLACAQELGAAGVHDVLVLEAAPRCGGPIESVRRDGWLIERGPCTVRSTPQLDGLFHGVGLEPVEGRRAAPLVVSGGRLLQLPPRAGELLRGTWLPRRALLSACAEPFRRPRSGPRSVLEFVAERFGRELALHAADLLTLGAFGAPAEQVGFESAFPDLARALERAGGRLSMLALRRSFGPRSGSPRASLVATADGLGPLPTRLAQALGARVHTGLAVRSVRARTGSFEIEYQRDGERVLAARRVVLALPPAQLAPLLDLPAARMLVNFPSTPQTLVQFGLDEPDCAARWTGLGFLAPSREQLPLLGCLFPSNLFPGCAPAGSMLLSVFVGPALRAASELTLARELAPLLGRLLEAKHEPTLLDVARHPAGIPLYDRDHAERLHNLRAAVASLPGMHLAGWGYDGIGLAAAAASGARAARAILEEH